VASNKPKHEKTSGESTVLSYGFEIITGKANPTLARNVAKILDISPDEPISSFSDSERRIVLSKELRRKHAVIIQSLSGNNVNDRIIELLGMIDAAKRESADEITIVMPYMAYQRQERRVQDGEPIMASLLPNLLVTAGADRIVTIDLHAEATIGSVNVPWINLYASDVLVPAIKEYFGNTSKVVVQTPDKGGFNRAIKYAEFFGTKHIASAYKQRDIDLAGKSKALFMIGDVKNKTVIMPDDVLASGGTLVDASNLAKSKGANRIVAAIAHGQFLDNAIEKIEKSFIEKIFVTDSIKIKNKVRNHPKVEVVPVDKLLAEAIYQIHTGCCYQESK
jgi:ribose-phosphate pyrophosphokinase